MAKHAIVLASEDWCRQAATGKVKVYDFLRGRKVGIRSLGPGSVCVVMTLRSRIVYGEFTVQGVKLVDTREYQELTRKGVIHSPQQLRPSDKVWVLFFDKFIEYPNKLHKSRFTNVRTATSKKPMSEWIVIGTTYIDDQALEAIRTIAGYTPPREQPPQPLIDAHACIEIKLLELGRTLGYKVYTSDATEQCRGRQLGELINLRLEELPMRDKLRRIDVVWYDYSRANYKLFEVVLTTDIRTSFTNFAELSELNADFFIVSAHDKKRKFDRVRRNPAFNIIRHRTEFIDLDALERLYELTKQWAEHAKILKLPYIQSI